MTLPILVWCSYGGRLPLLQLCIDTKIICVLFMLILFLFLSFKLPVNVIAASHLDVWRLRVEAENEKHPPSGLL